MVEFLFLRMRQGRYLGMEKIQLRIMSSVFMIILLAVGGPCVLAQTAEPEIFGPGIISGPVNDAAPAFSPDGKTVYFHRSGPSVRGTILVSHQRNGQWSAPDIASFSGRWSDIEPAMAPDGSYLIFASNRPVTPGGQPLNGTWNSQHYPGGGGNLWRVDRKAEGWGEPYRLPDRINSDSSIFSPAIASDGSLYFMKPVADTGKFHIYRAQYRNGQFEKPVMAPFSAADSISDVDAAVAPDESFVVFCSKRSPSNRMELFIVFRKNGGWGLPIDLGDKVNRLTYSIEARLSPDHRRLYFGSAYTPSPAAYPTEPGGVRQKLKESEWETGALNIWSVPLDAWIDGR